MSLTSADTSWDVIWMTWLNSQIYHDPVNLTFVQTERARYKEFVNANSKDPQSTFSDMNRAWIRALVGVCGFMGYVVGLALILVNI